MGYKGSLAGLKGMLAGQIKEGLVQVVSAVTDAASRKPEGGTEKIPLERIYPSPDQPRQVFDPRALEELSQTMRELGQAQAITVRKTNQGYEIISGERRYRAAKLAGLTELDCVVKDCSPQEARLLALVENIQRQDLLPIEEAHYLRKVLAENSDLSLERLARNLGSHKSTLSEKIQLTEIPEDLQAMLYGKGRHLTHRHWRVISRIPETAFLKETFLKAVEHQLSVIELEKLLETAGVKKAPRRRVSEDERARVEKPFFVREENGDFRFRGGRLQVSALSDESRALLADHFETAARYLRSLKS